MCMSEPGGPRSETVAANRIAYWLAAGLIWALALWHAWEMRALFGDGASFYLHAVHQDWFVHFYPARDYAMLASQVPLIVALKLGLDDPAMLSRFFCLGVFGLPAALYHLALARARHDALLLALAIASIALVFLPASFCAVSESIPGNAAAIAGATWLATAERARLATGFMVVALAAFALRTYESFVYVGPALAAMAFAVTPSAAASGQRPWPWLVLGTIAAAVSAMVGRYAIVAPLMLLLIGLALVAWQRPHARQGTCAALYLSAGSLFAASVPVALWSMITYLGSRRMTQISLEVFDVWTNPPLLLALGAAATLVVWAWLWPADLAGRRPYLGAGLWLIVLAVYPSVTLASGDFDFQPSPFGQCSSRIAIGPLTLVMIAAIWFCRPSSGRPAWPVSARSRLLAFAVLGLLATLPTDVFLTRLWSGYLAVVKETVRGHGGTITVDRTEIETSPYTSMTDWTAITCQSLILRHQASDAVIAPPPDYVEWTACSPGESDRLTRWFWPR